MKKHSLSLSKGISMSQAQTISNLCFQKCREISLEISQYNNSSKMMTYEGKEYYQQLGKPIPNDLKEKLITVSKYSAVQGFLMENMKSKTDLLEELKKKKFEFDEKEPEYPEIEKFIPSPFVSDMYGWEQLTKNEINEYILVEAYASHIGGFIHKGGKLDLLRIELPSLKALEFYNVGANPVPVEIKAHHTSKQLFSLHEELSRIHSEYEQKVNYFKAKVKNIVSDKNSSISAENSVKANEVRIANESLISSYKKEKDLWDAKYKIELEKFEEKRHREILNTSKLRIEIPEIFQDVIDEFIVLNKD